jgi:hypothetical protein
MGKGAARCAYCRGRGVVVIASSYRVCSCVRGTPAVHKINQRAAEARTGHKPLTMADMLRVGNTERRA